GEQHGTDIPNGEQHGTDIPNGEQRGTDTPDGEQRGTDSPGGGQHGTDSPGGGQHGTDSLGGGKPPSGGGSTPGKFFEHICWDKLSPQNDDQVGLIVALDELYRMSNKTMKISGRTVKIYEEFPVSAGMLLRTAYEQALILQLKKTNLWGSLLQKYRLPMLSNIESHVDSNINIALPLENMRKAFRQIKSARSRDFLNSNVHNPGLIRTTSATLEGLASGGMLSLIRLIIEYL
ncbi:hypothetical protein, partial [Aneurinibacillus thermoaerophilus]|uniref:hypothetical protein n=1 Tax=Aneurinibacillus thermoaerophilus TaxID=143495 RepID=UPI001C31B846